MSPKHASTVPLVLSLDTGAITPQFQVIFDDWFTTVTSDQTSLPHLGTPEWENLFCESTYQYFPDNEDSTDSSPLPDETDHTAFLICWAGAAREQQRCAIQDARRAREVVFTVHGMQLEAVSEFRYLGRPFLSTDDDWPAVYRKSQQSTQAVGADCLCAFADWSQSAHLKYVLPGCSPISPTLRLRDMDSICNHAQGVRRLPQPSGT